MGVSDRENLLGMGRSELGAVVAGMGEAPFRARQLYVNIYRNGALDFREMTDLSKAFRARLAERYAIVAPAIESVFRSSDGTRRYLLSLADGSNIEAVLIPDKGRHTICISTQVGCAVGCRFCMTAQLGLKRHLTAGEIVGQVIAVCNESGLRRAGPQRLNIVMMGMGEPLHNYDNTVKALRLLADPEGMAISPRRITLSTSGFAPALERLAREEVVPNLAISLNASSDEQRSQLIPINRRWNIERLIASVRRASELIGERRRITFEYVLLGGVNDSAEDARRLVNLIKGLRVKVNLIPWNPDPALPFQTPSEERIVAFQQILMGHNITATVRRPRGLDISAACGQLAARRTARPEVRNRIPEEAARA